MSDETVEQLKARIASLEKQLADVHAESAEREKRETARKRNQEIVALLQKNGVGEKAASDASAILQSTLEVVQGHSGCMYWADGYPCMTLDDAVKHFVTMRPWFKREAPQPKTTAPQKPNFEGLSAQELITEALAGGTLPTPPGREEPVYAGMPVSEWAKALKG